MSIDDAQHAHEVIDALEAAEALAYEQAKPKKFEW